MLSRTDHRHAVAKTGLEQLLELTAVLDAPECRLVRERMFSAPAIPGETSDKRHSRFSYQVDRKRRDVNIALLDTNAIFTINRRLEKLTPILESYYDVNLSGHESPQCLRYGPGQFYACHRDRHPQDEHSQRRRITVVMFLANSQSRESVAADFVGGGLRLYPYGNRADHFDLEERCGSGIAFPSNMLHEVRAVVQGARYSITTWFYSGA